jgi:predicted urease superfamily metal-dependent hydrolase
MTISNSKKSLLNITQSNMSKKINAIETKKKFVDETEYIDDKLVLSNNLFVYLI